MRIRSGFTTIELALVTVIVGVMSMVAYPKFASLRDRSDIDAAKRRLVSQLSTVRAVAVQRGRRAEMRVVNNAIWVTVEQGGTQQIVSGVLRLDSLFAVRVTASNDPVAYDSRGFAVSLPPAGAKYVLTNGTYTDSICVSKLGVLQTRGCGL